MVNVLAYLMSGEGPFSDLWMATYLLCPQMIEEALVPFLPHRRALRQP